jgi:hypothetical protein
MPSSTEHPHLQLCVNDLLHPTEKSETLLEALTATQLEEIEKTLNKIKIKKQSSSSGKAKIMTHKKLFFISFSLSTQHQLRQLRQSLRLPHLLLYIMIGL